MSIARFAFSLIILIALVGCSTPASTPDVAAIYTSVAGTMIAQMPTRPPTSTVAPLPTNTLAPTNTPAATLDAKSSLKVAIQTALGTSDRNIPRIRGISFDAFETGDIFVEWSINDNLTESMIKFGARDDVNKVLKAVADSGFNYTSVALQGYFPMQDAYGNSSEDMVLNLIYKKTTVDKINWANFDLNNVYIIADDPSYVVPAFQGQ
jgi:hypothetical protein